MGFCFNIDAKTRNKGFYETLQKKLGDCKIWIFFYHNLNESSNPMQKPDSHFSAKWLRKFSGIKCDLTSNFGVVLLFFLCVFLAACLQSQSTTTKAKKNQQDSSEKVGNCTHHQIYYWLLLYWFGGVLFMPVSTVHAIYYLLFIHWIGQLIEDWTTNNHNNQETYGIFIDFFTSPVQCFTSQLT